MRSRGSTRLAARNRRARLTSVAVVLVVVSLAPPVGADTRADLEAAQAQVAALRDQADQASADYQTAYAELSQTEDAIAVQEADLAATEQRLVELQQRAAERAIEAYMGGSYEDPLGVDAESALDAGRREALLDGVAADDVDLVDALDAARDDTQRLRAQLDALQGEQADLVTAMQAASDAALASLEQAQQLEAELEVRYAAELAEQRRREEEARRAAEAEAARQRAADQAAAAAAAAARTTTTAAPTATTGSGGEGATTTAPSSDGTTATTTATTTAPTTGGGGGGGSIPSGYTCPVPGSSFVDSWGAPRSGGRRHQGVDMMAPHGTPNLAVIGGSVSGSSSPLGGTSLYLRGDDGNTYYYAHLQAITKSGRVEQGDQIGEGGASGNASSTAPHTHFEVHIGGSSIVNPTPYVRAWC